MAEQQGETDRIRGRSSWSNCGNVEWMNRAEEGARDRILDATAKPPECLGPSDHLSGPHLYVDCWLS